MPRDLAAWRHRIERFFSGQQPVLRIGGAAVDAHKGESAEAAHPPALFPGSFNPLHRGHRRLHAESALRLNCEVAFELSVENVDKPTLSREDVEQRLAQFDHHETVLLTRAPRFLDKAQLFPGATFVLGADTLMRLADPRYWESPEAHLESLERLCQSARFLVFGRLIDGVFRDPEQVPLPACLAEACVAVSAAECRVDVSSSQLREREQSRE